MYFANNIWIQIKTNIGRLRVYSVTESIAAHAVHYMFIYIYIVFKHYPTILHFSTFLKDDDYHSFFYKIHCICLM